jgi:hypothetical protein
MSTDHCDPSTRAACLSVSHCSAFKAERRREIYFVSSDHAGLPDLRLQTLNKDRSKGFFRPYFLHFLRLAKKCLS